MIKYEVSFTINEQADDFAHLLEKINEYLKDGLNVNLSASVIYDSGHTEGKSIDILADGDRRLSANRIENIRVLETSNDYLENLQRWIDRNSKPSERI